LSDFFLPFGGVFLLRSCGGKRGMSVFRVSFCFSFSLFGFLFFSAFATLYGDFPYLYSVNHLVHISHSGAQIKCLTGQKIAAHQNNLKNEATQDLRFSKVKQGVAWGRAGYSRHQEVELEVEMETSGGEPRGKTNQNVARTRRSQLDIMDAHFQ